MCVCVCVFVSNCSFSRLFSEFFSMTCPTCDVTSRHLTRTSKRCPPTRVPHLLTYDSLAEAKNMRYEQQVYIDYHRLHKIV